MIKLHEILVIYFYFVLTIQCHLSLTKDATMRFTVQFRSSLDDPKAVEEDHNRFLSYLSQHHVMDNIQIRYNYTNVFNGMSIEILPPAFSAASANKQGSPQQLSIMNFIDYTLSTCPFVDRYWPGKRYPRPKSAFIEQHTSKKQEEQSLAEFFNTSMDDIPLVIDVGKPNLEFAHHLTTVDRAKMAGWTGQGIKVGILDTGIDYTHPALGGCFGEGCKVRYGKDLVGDSFNGPNKLMKPSNDPLDQCDGHGTHIAGIIAANDTYKGFEGVAPGVTLGAWRIFGCQGDTDDDVIIAAAEMAVKAGMNIINLSLGGGLGSWQEDPLAVALSNIAKNNITIVVAQGNEGKDGFFRTPSPAIGEHLISVGSVDNSKRFASVIEIFDETNNTKGVFEYFIRDNRRFTVDETAYNYTAYHEAKSACQLNTDVPLKNRVVIVDYDQDCNYTHLIRQLEERDAEGILIYPKQQSDSIDLILKDKQFDDLNLPIGMMSVEDGYSLVHLLNVSTLIQFTATMIKTKTGGKSSDFSTWGPDPELHFKPDISAVGGYMYSTYPVNLGAYATLSGTSMATPYLSGCLALLMEATKNINSNGLIKRLINYAKPVLKLNHDTTYENPIKQGSGLVQVFDSILGGQSITPSVLPLNDTANFLNKPYITIYNYSNQTKLFKFDYIPSIGIKGYNFTESAVPLLKPVYDVQEAKVIFEKDVIMLAANQSQSIAVNFVQPKLKNEDHLIYGGFIEISSGIDNSTMFDKSHVAFFGALGNQKDLPILDTKTGYPFLGDSFGKKYNDEQLVFNFSISPFESMTSNVTSVLHIYSRLGNPTAKVKYQLLKENTVIGEIPIGSNHYLSRNDHSKENYDYVLAWKGELLSNTTKRNYNPQQQQKLNAHSLNIKNIMTIDKKANTKVPIGLYRICISVLKIFGNPTHLEDWQIWYSPIFSVIG